MIQSHFAGMKLPFLVALGLVVSSQIIAVAGRASPVSSSRLPLNSWSRKNVFANRNHHLWGNSETRIKHDIQELVQAIRGGETTAVDDEKDEHQTLYLPGLLKSQIDRSRKVNTNALEIFTFR